MDKKDFKLNDNKLTQKEIEAVTTSRAMDLLDRSRKLNEDKEKERVKEDKLREKEQKEKDREQTRKKVRKWMIIIGGILIILLLLFQAYIYIKNQTPDNPTPKVELEYADTTPVGDYKPPTEGISKITKTSKVYSITGGYQLETGDSEFDLKFEVDKENKYPQKILLYLSEQRRVTVQIPITTKAGLIEMVDQTGFMWMPTFKIYESKLVQPDREIVKAKMDKVLPAGSYMLIASIQVINPETGLVVDWSETTKIPLDVLK